MPNLLPNLFGTNFAVTYSNTIMSSHNTELDDFMQGREFEGHLAVSRSPSAPADRTPEPQTNKKRKAEKEPEVSDVSSV